METPLINKPRRWILKLNNLPTNSIEEQDMAPSLKEKVVFPEQTLKALEAVYCDIDRLYYYGFSYKLIKVIIDGLGVFRLDADGARGSGDWQSSMEQQEESQISPDKEKIKKLEELGKAEQKVLERSGFMRQRNQMSSSMTFPTLIHIIQFLYEQYAAKHNLGYVKKGQTVK